MIFIQHLFRHLQIQAVLAALFPGHVQYPVEIGPDNGCLRGVRVHHIKSFQLLQPLFLHLGRHPCFLEPGT